MIKLPNQVYDILDKTDNIVETRIFQHNQAMFYIYLGWVCVAVVVVLIIRKRMKEEQ